MFIVLFLIGLAVILSIGVTHLFDLPDERYRSFIVPLVVLSAVVAAWLPDRTDMDEWKTGILSYGALYIALVKPLCLYMLARIRGIGPEQANTSPGSS